MILCLVHLIDAHALKFVDAMKKEFEMSIVGEHSYFPSLQIKQHHKGLYIFQSKYAIDLVKRFNLENSKHTRTLMITSLKWILIHPKKV